MTKNRKHSSFKYENTESTEIKLGVYEIILGRDTNGMWRDDIEPRVYRKTLLGAMHPGIHACIVQIPSDKSILSNPELVRLYEEALREGVPAATEVKIDPTGPVPVPDDASNPAFNIKPYKLYVDIAGSSRAHGAFIATNARKLVSDGERLPVPVGGIGDIYFDNEMGRINYGSILLTECRKIVRTEKIKVLVVDDEIPEYRKTGVGDSHGRVKREILVALSTGVDQGGNAFGEHTRPLQIRCGWKNERVWKGTVIAWDNDTLPPIYGDNRDSYQMVLPLSGFKGRKPKHGDIIESEVYIGNVHFAENRSAKASQQIWQWYTPDCIERDIVPGIVNEAKLIVENVSNRKGIAKLFRDVELMRRNIDYDQGDFDGEALSEDFTPGENQEGGYKDPVVEIVANDKFGVLIDHPWVADKIKDRLSSWWKRLALNSAVQFRSLMAEPDDSIPKYQFVAKDIPEGWCIVFRNPVLHHGSIKLMKSIKDSKYDWYLKNKGAVFMSHETAAEVQGDFDGDFFQFFLIPSSLKAKAERYINMTPGEKDNLYNLYLAGELDLEPFESIIIETVLMEWLWGETPVITKPKKNPVQGTVEWVAIRSMDNQTGLISNLIQHAKANGTLLLKVAIPNHDWFTGEYTGGSTMTTVLKFLSQEMQIAVDRLKNNLYHNEKGIAAVSEAVNSNGKPRWLHERAYKHPMVYKDRIIPVGQVKYNNDTYEWEEVSDSSYIEDSVSIMISTVNHFWEPYIANDRKVGEFRTFFDTHLTRRSYDIRMVDWARFRHIWYGTAMSEAANFGKDKPNPDSYIDERKKRMRVVREQALDIRTHLEELELFLTKRNLSQRALWEIYDDVTREYPHGVKTVTQVDNGKISVPGIATIDDWVAAFWDASHGEQSDGKAGIVFRLFIDKIVERLNKPTPANKMRFWHANLFPMGDFVFGDPNAVVDPGFNEPEFEKRPKRVLNDPNKPHNLFRPSKVYSSGRIVPPEVQETTNGFIIPNKVELKVEPSDEYTNSRTPQQIYYIYVRTPGKVEFTKFAKVDRDGSYPEFGVLCEGTIYTIGLTSPEPYMSKKNVGGLGYRTTKGIIVYREYTFDDDIEF